MDLAEIYLYFFNFLFYFFLFSLVVFTGDFCGGGSNYKWTGHKIYKKVTNSTPESEKSTLIKQQVWSSVDLHACICYRSKLNSGQNYFNLV